MPTLATSSILTPTVLATAAKFKGALDFQERERGLIARRNELHVLSVCVVVKMHPLLYGKPGVAKSMSVDGLMMHLPELSKFKTQAYKASPPEQFLGPISIKGMEQDRFVRIVTGKLPDVEIAVVDEVARAPRAVLPAFQGLMVEREFDSGEGVMPVPLQSFIGTANHIPEDPELEAFFDRWAFKLIVVGPQSQEQFKSILRGALKRQEFGEPAIPDELLISRAELAEFQKAATTVNVPEPILDALAEMWSNVVGRGIESSPRRYTDLVKATRGVALLDGRDEVSQDDLQIAMHSLWNVESEAPVVREEVVKLASAWVQEKVELLDTFAETLDRLGQVQTLVAAGTETSAHVEIQEGDKKVERSIIDHAIRVVGDNKTLRALIDRHIADATGQDTSELTAVLAQMDAGQTWVQDRILGGLAL